MCEARNFTACVDEICDAVDKICSAGFEGGFSAARRRSKICSVKYDAEFCSAAHGDKIYGAMADKKGLGAALASVRNSGLKNACVNLRPLNTYVDLKFKGSANSEPAGDANFKFKNGASGAGGAGGAATGVGADGAGRAAAGDGGAR
ncbi:hypothetical protein, partial [uncultured Campylobacter sp.]|uniref:hypothetical protein n=1 Tax=uncultured Campylobacter sp. TaxID=218934 RepID=UPI00260D8EDB